MSNARTTSRTTQIAVRLSHAELYQINGLCAVRNQSLAEAVREAIAAWPTKRVPERTHAAARRKEGA